MPEANSTVVYRDIPGFPGYRVGSDGSVWSAWKRGAYGKCSISDNWKQLKIFFGDAGRPQVTLTCDGKLVSRRVCKLVLETFIGPRPKGMSACHFPDRNPTNNNLENLRWGTQKENVQDSIKHGTWVRGETQGQSKLTDEIVRIARELYVTGKFTHLQLAEKFGVAKATMRCALLRLSWKHVI